jgi:hypothetical protein
LVIFLPSALFLSEINEIIQIPILSLNLLQENVDQASFFASFKGKPLLHEFKVRIAWEKNSA